MSRWKVLPYHTIKDWERWDGSWELIEGIPYAMSPAPLPKHQRISLLLSIAFEQALENCTKCNVYQAIDWIINEDTILQPDVLIVCGEIDNRLDFAPDLVV